MFKQFFIIALFALFTTSCSIQHVENAAISNTIRDLEEVNRTLEDVNRTLQCTNHMLRLDPHQTFEATMKRYNKSREDVTKRDIENYLSELNAACKESLKK